MLVWNKEDKKLKLIDWPDDRNPDNKYYGSSTLACYTKVRKSTFEERKAYVFIEAVHLIVRDGLNHDDVHKTLMGLEEYRDGCACDMPLMNKYIDNSDCGI